MRSGGVAWLLDLYGFKVYTLIGGYKSFRNWVLQQFNKSYNFNVLGGYTGSGKTEVLQALKSHGHKVIDLEQFANHKGSSFGSLGMPEQPSQEMFENKLAVALSILSKTSSENNQYTNEIWLEDESQRIGSVNIPIPLWQQIRSKHTYFLNVPFNERLEHIINWYGKGDREKLIAAILRIKKRLGGLETKTAINHLVEDNMKECFSILLKYYDKWYLKGLNNRDNALDLVTTFECTKVDAIENMQKLLANINNK